MRSRVLVTVLVVSAALVSQVGSQLSAQSSAAVVISQVYGGGGNVGAVYKNDFIELFNRSAATVDLSGWSVQYASAAGTTWATTALIGTLPPGGYYLVQEAAGAGTQPVLPTPNATGTIAMSATSAKVALVSSTAALTGACPASVIDFVGYGTAATCSETAPTATLTNATAAIRLGHGCTDTNANNGDFAIGTPAPRNSATTLAPCEASTNPSFTATAATPSPVQQGQLLTVAATVAPGSGPVSTGLAVAGDLSQVGGLVSQALFDNGLAPDANAGDNIFTTSVAVPGGNPLGSRTIALTVTDAQSRSGSTTFSVTVAPPPVIRLPHEIQGVGTTSPFPVGTGVTVRAVVTARKFNGFYIQTEPGMEDADAHTSEGLFVFTSGAPAAIVQVGRLVEVSGTVAEFSPGADPTSPPVTELTGPTVIDLGASTVPAAFTLTPDEVSPGGTLNQLERFEGMRVSAVSLTAISGTGGQKTEAAATSTSDGAFDVIFTGQPRPFREPGLEPGAPALNCANFPGPCNIPAFDGNPERLRVDSNALDGTAIVNVSSGAVFTDVTGPLDYTFRTYTILPETTLVPVGGLAVTPAPSAGPNQFTVASFNMERFYDDVNDPGGDVALTALAYNKRLSKASLAIRNVLNMPDIIGVQEVEKLSVLETLATKVNADAGAASPGYQAYLVEGNDQGGIDVGFLVKTAGGRVIVNSVVQVGKDATFVNPTTGGNDLLNDRPPLVLRATIQGPPTSLPQHVTVITNHLRSLIGVELNDATGRRVRAKRKAQAEFLADYIQDIQLGDATEAVISVGDYNAFSFNDGYGDSIGTIRGAPAPADQVVTASPDLVEPNLTDLAGLIPAADGYSYVFGGNAQTLDHVIVTANLVGQFVNLVHPRVNADFPEVLRGDATIPQRLSDHDPAVAYFVFPADTAAPVFSFTPQDQEAEAASAAGAVVTYAVPTATDNLDGDVDVNCAPASGATFALGNTAASCTAVDLAGNVAVVTFTVTVHDTTAPQLTVPANITAQASSPAGLLVSFVASATDAVTAAPVVTCAPASGTTFPIGVTTVQCSALDGADNRSAGGSFSVTITPVVPGRMHGDGTIGSGAARVVFHLDIQESANYVDTGSLVLKIGANDFSAGVSEVLFSGAAGFSSGAPQSANNTVTFAGSGSWNGHPGYLYRAVATDRGEPGRGNDTLAVVVSAPDGAVVASIGGVLASGNNQSLK